MQVVPGRERHPDHPIGDLLGSTHPTNAITISRPASPQPAVPARHPHGVGPPTVWRRRGCDPPAPPSSPGALRRTHQPRGQSTPPRPTSPPPQRGRRGRSRAASATGPAVAAPAPRLRASLPPLGRQGWPSPPPEADSSRPPATARGGDSPGRHSARKPPPRRPSTSPTTSAPSAASSRSAAAPARNRPAQTSRSPVDGNQAEPRRRVTPAGTGRLAAEHLEVPRLGEGEGGGSSGEATARAAPTAQAASGRSQVTAPARHPEEPAPAGDAIDPGRRPRREGRCGEHHRPAGRRGAEDRRRVEDQAASAASCRA